jgi:hypothetical protein
MAGNAVTITGTNFSSTPQNNRVRFNNVAPAIVTSSNTTSTATTVPTGTGSGKISLSNPSGTAVSPVDFFIPFKTHVVADVGYTGRTTIGATQNVTLAANKIAIVLFDATAEQHVSVLLSGSTFSSATLYLFAPNGSQLATSTSTIPSTALPVAGTYAVGIETPSGGSAGLQVVSDVTGTIAIDGPPVTATTNVSGQDVRLTFGATAEQQIVLTVTNVTNPLASIALLGPTGQTLLLQPFSSFSWSINNNPAGQLFFLDQQTLPTTGTYTLWVQHSGTGVGSETLQLNSAQDFIAPITPGGPSVRFPATGDNLIGQNGRLTFTGTPGHRVSMNVSGGTYTSACYVGLKDPTLTYVTSGWTCGSGATTFVDSVTLNTAGTYTVFVDPQARATGHVTVQLNDCSDVTGTISIDGGAVTATTSVQGQDARLTFTGTAGQRIVVLVTGVTNPSATVNILKPDGSTEASVAINNNPTGQTFFINTQTLVTTGTYTLWVQHSGTNVGSETLQLNSVPADYTASLTPGTAAQVPASGSLAIGQNASLTFNGSAGFDESIQFTSNTLGAVNVALLKPDGTTLTSVASSAASFSLPMQMLPTTGVYTLQLTRTIPTSGSLTVLVSLLGGPRALPSRPAGSSVDPSNGLSQNLVGLFVMNEGTGTTDKNLVDGQVANFAGTNTPGWNTSDPSVLLNGTTTSLSSYLDAGTDLNFDQMVDNKMTVVARVYLNSVQAGGIVEKTDGNVCGFIFGFDNTGALIGLVNGYAPTFAKTGAGAVISGQWMQLAFTWDGTAGNTASTSVHIYVNGVEQTKASSESGISLCSSGDTVINKSLRIGNATSGVYTGLNGSLNGRVAYLAVYKYRVLTPTELNQLDTQLPISSAVVSSMTEAGGSATVTTTTSGQSADVTFNGWADQQVTVQLSNNTMGAVNVSLVAPNGSTVTSTSSSSASFNLTTATLPLNGTYDVLIQPTGSTTGSITVSLVVPDGRATGSVVDPSNGLSQNLVGLFVMNEGTGTTDKNIVDGQVANFAGTNMPSWNTADPSVVLNGTTTSLSSYLDAGTDLNFDQMVNNKMTVVAKVFLNSVQAGGVVEKTDGSVCGFIFGFDSTGALIGLVNGYAATFAKTGAGAVTSGQWTQVAFTWDGTAGNTASSSVHIYVNGVEQAKASSQSGTSLCLNGDTVVNKSLRIGNATSGVYTGLNGSLYGRIAYLAVYRGRVLSATDLTQLDALLPMDAIDVSGTVTPNGSSSSATITTAGQSARLTFSATAGQNATVQLTGNALGSTTVSLLNVDGTTLASATSSAATFSLPPALLPNTGQYAVYIHPAGGTGSISAAVTLTTLPPRSTTAVLDTTNPLSTSLQGLFLMNEGTGTTDKNLVDSQAANFSGGSQPTWNTTDPSVVLGGGASLNSYLNAGTDLAFDQVPTSQITVVAKVYVSTLAAGGLCEKNDGGSLAGFSFGWNSSGALRLTVEKSSSWMYAATSSNAIPTGQWAQVAVTWDGTVGTAAASHIYVNGVEQTKISTSDGSGTLSYANATNQPFRIGNSSIGNSGSLNGKIAYLAVYRGTILTTQQMAQLDAQLPIH